MEEGTFHQTAVETIRGPKRCSNAGIYRYDRRREQLDVFVSYGFANPWGQTFDRWGQYFVADASGGANYFGTAFSGDVDYPQKHASLKQFLQKQWRPTSGCEFVSSRQFPDDAQGNYLLNNCIGFQGILQYKMREEGSGYAADPVDPLLRSNDPNFRRRRMSVRRRLVQPARRSHAALAARSEPRPLPRPHLAGEGEGSAARRADEDRRRADGESA
jgi:hypothetical protein